MVIVPTAAWLTQNRRICGHSSAAHQDEDEDEDEGEDDEDDVYHHWLSLWWWSMLWFFIQRVIAIPISAEHFPVIFSVPKKWRQKSQQHGVSAWIQTYYNVCIYIQCITGERKKTPVIVRTFQHQTVWWVPERSLWQAAVHHFLHWSLHFGHHHGMTWVAGIPDSGSWVTKFPPNLWFKY